MLMVEGKLPLEVGENTLDAPYNENADEKIWQSFENLKDIVKKMKLSKVLS